MEIIKLKASYKDDKALGYLMDKLKPDVVSCKLKPPKGRFKRAYIDLKTGDPGVKNHI